MHRTHLIGITILALALAACKGKKGDEDKKPTKDPDIAALDTLAKASQRLPNVTARRAPVRARPAGATDPRASTYYVRAATFTTEFVTPETTLAKISSYVPRWATAPAAVRTAAKSVGAQQAARWIMEGAVADTGASPVAPGTSPASIVAAGVAAIATSMEQATAGNGEQAAWGLIGVIRLGQDLARTSTTTNAAAGASLMRPALAGLRLAVTTTDKKRLDDKKVSALLDSCLVLRKSQLRYVRVLSSEHRLRATALVAAKKSGQPSVLVKADIEKQGGIFGLAKKMAAQALAIKELATVHRKRGAEQQELMAAKQKEIWGDKGHPGLDPDAFARWQLATGDLDGTCVVIAMELYRRKHGDKLPAKLDELTPKPLEKPILDRIGKQPWEYTDNGFGGRLLRSMPLVIAGKPATVEMLVAARKKAAKKK